METDLGSCDTMHNREAQFIWNARADRSTRRGRTFVRTFLNDQAVDYFLRIPSNQGSGQRLLVAVHGIRRNPLQHMIHLSTVAEELGAVLIAPYFPKAEYPRFQRFRAQDGHLHPDLRLGRIIADACRVADLHEPAIDLFGFSAGAQFVHRYAMAHPTGIAHVICASAGWYTLPDFGLDFPLGLRQREAKARWQFDPQAFTSIPMLVAVGENDIGRGISLNVRPEVDELQGKTRLERAVFWVDAMNALAMRFGKPANVTFRSLGQSGHSLRRCVLNGGLTGWTREFLSNGTVRAE